MRIYRAAAFTTAVCGILATAVRAAPQEPPVLRPRAPIALFNGHDLSGFDTWLVDHHDQDPDRVFSVVDQIDGAPAIRISGQRWGGIATRARDAHYRLGVEVRRGLPTWGGRKTAPGRTGRVVPG